MPSSPGTTQHAAGARASQTSARLKGIDPIEERVKKMTYAELSAHCKERIPDYKAAVKHLEKEKMIPKGETEPTMEVLISGLMHFSALVPEKERAAMGLAAFAVYAKAAVDREVSKQSVSVTMEVVEDRMAGMLERMENSARAAEKTVEDLREAKQAFNSGSLANPRLRPNAFSRYLPCPCGPFDGLRSPQFADVLENFESQFYQQALQKFQSSDFTSAGFVDAQVPIQQFTAIQSDEASHATVLETTIQSLGDSPIQGCQFNFGNALNDVPTMAATARVVENLGVGAYLGAAHLISDPVLLTAAGSILTVEARHQTILNVLNNGVSIPQAFDIALLPNEVLAVASAFISGCDVGIQANQPLTITNTGSVGPGTTLTFSSPAINGSTDGLFCQMLVGGMPTSVTFPLDQCVVPDGIEAPSASSSRATCSL
ncbi:hypothetical protein NUW54_g8905 [Trametes sanguinea]|uniref:Uncharacterized protein n=1 Tax=Trametes sanguinea TaxID=158606 RepID=A0ACC1PCP9_9APHY|nr:hypothetical protein NUW54_g8905 [Trametes sanguinea]